MTKLIPVTFIDNNVRTEDILKKFKNQEVLLLYPDNWNDYSYRTICNTIYVDKNGNQLDLGILKLGHEGMNTDFEVEGQENIYYFLHKIDKYELNNKFFSLAQDQDFYARLKENKDTSLITRVLISLKEITIQKAEFIKRVSNETVFKKSLTRYEFSKCMYELTIFKNKILEAQNLSESNVDTFSFVKTLPKESKLEEQFENNFFKITKDYYKQFFLIRIAVDYIKNKPILKERYSSLLEYIKGSYSDRTAFVSEINELQSNSGDPYSQFKINIERLKKLLYLDIEDINDNLVLGHYTSMNSLKYLIKPRALPEGEDPAELRLTNSRQLNDPMEGKILLDYILENHTDQFIHSHIYLASATTEIDSLPMWKQYADDATGISLIYDADYLCSLIQNPDIGVQIAKICYFSIDSATDSIVLADDSDIEIKEILNNIKRLIHSEGLKSNDVLSQLNQISLLFKNKEYSYENEYRIMFDIEDLDKQKIELINKGELFPIPFLYTYLSNNPLKYKEVILGPKAMDIDYVGPYIKHCDFNMKIDTSKISYR